MFSNVHSDINIAEEQSKKTSFEELLIKQGYLVYTAKGRSMMPLIRPQKDVVEIRPVISYPKKYDVVLYKRRGQYILHRCISTNPYIFAGDHNTFKEYDITADMILGVMRRVIRNEKSIYPSNLLYKIYYHLWVDFFPIKALILKMKAKIISVGSRIKRKLTDR